MRKNWLLLGFAFLVAALAIFAVACGDDDDIGDEAPAATEEQMDDVADDMDDNGDDMADDSATVIITDGILTDSAGNTLYIFDNDEPGLSNCADGCAGVWPPLTLDGDATAGEGVDGVVGTIMRDDGSTQATYNDQPLYYYAADEAPGDRNGDGVGGIWHVVDAAG